MTRFEEFLVYDDGREGTEVEKKNLRSHDFNTNLAKKWEIGELIDYNPVGCLRHVDIVDTKDGDGGTGKITEQEWIEGSSLALD